MPYIVEDLLATYRSKKDCSNPRKIEFTALDGLDAYNITATFNVDGETYIAARVEARDSEISKIIFFKEQNGKYIRDEQIEPLNLQDPFISKINGQFVIGGVEVFPSPENPNALWWKTCFYRGNGIKNLQKFFEGPRGMKDIRLIELPDKRIGVFTRPQQGRAGRGKIGFYIADSLDDISIQGIENAELLDDLFIPEEWGGANEIHLLDENRVGVLGHIAKFSENETLRHYYSMSFIFDYKNFSVSDFKIIAERSDLLDGPSKNNGLVDVIFSGGIIRRPNAKSTLYLGVSDAEAQCIDIPDPFANAVN